MTGQSSADDLRAERAELLRRVRACQARTAQAVRDLATAQAELGRAIERLDRAEAELGKLAGNSGSMFRSGDPRLGPAMCPRE
jgi:predicted KAP-like P-loop ATPase